MLSEKNMHFLFLAKILTRCCINVLLTIWLTILGRPFTTFYGIFLPATSYLEQSIYSIFHPYRAITNTQTGMQYKIYFQRTI